MKSLRVLLVSLVGMYVSSVMGQESAITVNIQNDVITRYMNEVTYTSQNDASRIGDYVVPMEMLLDKPKPVIIEVPDKYKKFIKYGTVSVSYSFDESFAPTLTNTIIVEKDEVGISIYDIEPGKTCYYRIIVFSMPVILGKIITEGPVRMIYTPSVRNVRDMGGWVTSDGRRIRYGKLFRGSELNGQHLADNADIQHLLDLGVSAELDLRANYEESHGISAFGFKDASQVEDGETPTYFYANDSGQLLSHLSQYAYLQRWKSEFAFIVNNLRAGRSIYQHCRWGADRTGYLSLLLEGMLGVTYDGLVKDYELTSCFTFDKSKEKIDPVISFIENLNGETLQEKFITFWTKRVGVNQEDIDYFIDEMLEGEIQDDDVTTGVTFVSRSVMPANECYDLQGRRINGRGHGLMLRRLPDGRVIKQMSHTSVK